jgi:7-cyano-7-deazaguanine synthase in queuosine biosynthesis
MKRIVLVSGGLDSTLCWHYIKDLPGWNIPVFINYGQPYLTKEWNACTAIFQNFDLMEVALNLTNEASNSFIPSRNVLLACSVNAKYQPDEIYIAGLKDDVVEDKNPEAFKEMSRILTKFSRKQVDVLSPFWDKTKGQIVADFIRSEATRAAHLELLGKTISCYDRHHPNFCGRCAACFRWFVAMESNNISTLIDLDKKLILEYLAKIHTYDSNRIFNTIRAVSQYFSQVTVIDIDGVITKETKGHDYAKRTPDLGKIERINNLYENLNHLVILYSSRFEVDREVTKGWLRLHKVKYHCLLLEKIPYDNFYDDKASTKFECY